MVYWIYKMLVAEIKPYEKNAKAHPKKQVEQIAASIKEFGFNQPIVVDEQNTVIVGHGRLEAAKILGLTDVPTITVKLTDEQSRAYRLADNKLNESEWDMNLVIEELKGLSEPMLELTGFDKDLLIEPDAQDDVIPENVPPTAKLGDLYLLGNHRVLCGDATKREDVERLMDGKKADMVFTDPPYGVDYDGGMKEWKVIENDGASQFEQIIQDAFKNLAVASKEGSGWYIWHASNTSEAFYKALRLAGRKVSAQIVWVKNNMAGGFGDYRGKHEPCIYSHGQFYAGRDQHTVWNENKETNYQHPTQKPVLLGVKAITNSSKAEDIILDLFLGSGSTLIAAEKTGRICYGMELDPKYVDVIVKRWEDYTGQKSVKVV